MTDTNCWAYIFYGKFWGLVFYRLREFHTLLFKFLLHLPIIGLKYFPSRKIKPNQDPIMLFCPKNQVPVHNYRQAGFLFRPLSPVWNPCFPICLCTGKTWFRDETAFWGLNQALFFGLRHFFESRPSRKKGFVIPSKSFVKIGITKIFCYSNKMFGSINKTFGCCGKIFGCSIKNFICCP